MPTDIEIERLDESLLEGTPPCGCRFRYSDGSEELCGEPSVARVHTVCPACGRVDVGFMCQECIDDLLAGKTECRLCRTHLTSWRFT